RRRRARALEREMAHCFDAGLTAARDDGDRTRDVAGLDALSEYVPHADQPPGGEATGTHPCLLSWTTGVGQRAYIVVVNVQCGWSAWLAATTAIRARPVVPEWRHAVEDRARRACLERARRGRCDEFLRATRVRGAVPR